MKILQWCDLDFTYEIQTKKVKLNGNNYNIEYYKIIDYYRAGENTTTEVVKVKKEDWAVLVTFTNTDFAFDLKMKQLFNDMNFEVVE